MQKRCMFHCVGPVRLPNYRRLIRLGVLSFAFVSANALSARYHFTYEILATNCRATPGVPPAVRRAQGFTVRGENGVFTSLHVVAGCKTIQARALKDREFKKFRIGKISIRQDLVFLVGPKSLEKGARVSRNGEVPGKSLVMPYIYGANQRVLKDLSYSSKQTLRVFFSSSLSAIKVLQKRQSPHLDIQILSITGRILPGDSGSPILNAKGLVVGVVSGGKLQSRSGMISGSRRVVSSPTMKSFAIPFSSNTLRTLKSFNENDPAFQEVARSNPFELYAIKVDIEPDNRLLLVDSCFRKGVADACFMMASDLENQCGEFQRQLVIDAEKEITAELASRSQKWAIIGRSCFDSAACWRRRGQLVNWAQNACDGGSATSQDCRTAREEFRRISGVSCRTFQDIISSGTSFD